MRALTLSDQVVPFIYSPLVKQHFQDVDLILACGDLYYYYLEYVFNALNVPLFFIRGNHDSVIEYGSAEQRTDPHGGIDLHCRHYCHQGLLLAGIEGSIRYRNGPFQYTQSQMWKNVLGLIPGLMINRLRYGRYLDVFISHAPPFGIHDCPDLPHQGVKAFYWLITTFKPAYFIHGHIHLYQPNSSGETRVGNTRIINTYGFRRIELELDLKR